MGGGFGFGPIGMIVPGLLTWLLIVAVSKLLTRGRVGPGRWVGGKPFKAGGGEAGSWAGGAGFRGFPGGAPEDAAFETLRMRLANGDITTEEYLERTSVLRSGQVPPPAEGSAS